MPAKPSEKVTTRNTYTTLSLAHFYSVYSYKNFSTNVLDFKKLKFVFTAFGIEQRTMKNPLHNLLTDIKSVSCGGLQ